MQPLVLPGLGTSVVKGSRAVSACRISWYLLVGTKWHRDKRPGPSRGGHVSVSAWPVPADLSWPSGHWVKGTGCKKMSRFLWECPWFVQPLQRVWCRSPSLGRAGAGRAGAGRAGAGRAGAGRLRYRSSGCLLPAGPAARAPELQGKTEVGVTVWAGNLAETSLAQ